MWFHVQLDQKNLKRTLIKRLVLDDLDFSFTNLSHFYRYVCNKTSDGSTERLERLLLGQLTVQVSGPLEATINNGLIYFLRVYSYTV